MFAEIIIKPPQTFILSLCNVSCHNCIVSFSQMYNSCLYGNSLRTLCSLWMIWKRMFFHFQRHSRHNRAPWLFEMRDREKWLLAPTLNKISISAHHHLWCDGKQHTMCDRSLNRFSYCYIRALMTEIVVKCSWVSLTHIVWAEYGYFN